MYIGFIIGTERATRRKNRNSVSSRAEVTIDKVLCLCNAFMATVPGRQPGTDGDESCRFELGGRTTGPEAPSSWQSESAPVERITPK